ncbi:MAG: DUF4276 family protein [Actinomycetota bacterium]|nr:DUF4276 family protein [Actinomycetota bacterium]
MTQRWLGLALFAEGPADHRFLDELLRRSVEHILTNRGHGVDLSQVLRLPLIASANNRGERIVAGALELQAAFHLLFIHADGGTDPLRSRVERVVPGMRAMTDSLGSGRAGVPVVPVRETEAWALADYDILAQVLSTSKTPSELELPDDPADLEALVDPKRKLHEVVRAARPGRRGRRRPSAAAFLDLLGERARISELSRLPAFACMLGDIDIALDSLGYRR